MQDRQEPASDQPRRAGADAGDGAARSAAGRFVLLAGIGLIGFGMVFVIAGIVVPALFRPGTFAIGFGMLACGASGLLSVASGRKPGPA